MEHKYILSICIPTRNRADVLVHTINAIVNNPYFSDEIEVVVSDNGSTDGTKDLMTDYESRFKNVRYYREEENLGMHGNILRAANLATGEFLKLNNDYNVFTEDGLKYILEFVKDHRKEKPVLFFEHIGGEKEIIEHIDINGIVAREGWRFSWMTSYGFWKEDWDNIPDKSSRVETMFVMDGHFLKMMEQKGYASICSAHFSDRYPFQQKQGGYNFFKVHTIGYLSLFKEYYKSGKLSKSAYDELHYKLFNELQPFLIKFIVTDRDMHSYGLKGWMWFLFVSFGAYPWFYKKMIRTIAKMIKYRLK